MRNGYYVNKIQVDLSSQERFALIFFSKCLFPNLFQKKSSPKFNQAKKFGILNVRMSTISENLLTTASLGRYGAMTAKLHAERARNITRRINRER